jgi:glycosyltransferase involved in cell wall biosynthesis
LGFWAAHRAGVPVMGSWHTNLHEYAERRLQSSLCFLPGWIRNWLSRGARDAALWAMVRFYRIMHFLAAPNQEMVEMLERRTGRASFLMAHGADTTLFAPERRERTDDTFTIGYVGRLTPEKNVRAMAELERSLVRAGTRRFRIVMVGGGTELPWLKEHVRTGEFPGVLRGVPLARQFANMDAFVFPSLTDTFGLVILEAMSSRVPVVLPPETGLRAGVMDGVDGYLSRDFAGSVQRLMSDETTRQRMATAAREHALARNWPGVFDDLYRIYGEGLDAEGTRRRLPKPKF